MLGLLSRRPEFDPLEFRRDVLRLHALYRVRGYPDVEVDTVLHRDGNLVNVEFRISEGSPMRVVSMTFSGLHDVVSLGELVAAIPMARGDPLDRIRLEATVGVIASEFRNRGFPFVNVAASVRTDSASHEADLLFSVNRGPLATIDTIQVVGTEAIDPRFVLQTVSVRSGDVYRESGLYESQLALYRSDLFSYASVGIADSGRKLSDSTVNVNVRVDVLEGPLERIRLGGGYGTMDCFRALGRLDLNNLLGDGRILELRASASKIGVGSPVGGLENSVLCRAFRDEDTSRLKLNYRLSATVREPLLFARNTEMRVSVFAERYTEFQAFLRQSIGGRVSATRKLGADMPLTLSYGLSRGKTIADAVTLCQYLSVCLIEDTRFFAEPRRRSELSASFVRDRTNSLYNATSGAALTVEGSWASSMIGSDSLIQYTRAVLEYTSYHELSDRGVFAWRARMGTVLSPTLGFSSGERAYTPPEARFFLGGSNTVRGYAFNRLGPVVYVIDSVATFEQVADTTVQVSASGGDLLALANVELRFPLGGGNRFQGVVFVDAGFIGDRVGQFEDRYRITPGAGMRVGTPVGPIRLDVGYNPHPSEPGSMFRQEGGTLVEVVDRYSPAKSWLDHFRLHFSIGQAF